MSLRILMVIAFIAAISAFVVFFIPSVTSGYSSSVLEQSREEPRVYMPLENDTSKDSIKSRKSSSTPKASHTDDELRKTQSQIVESVNRIRDLCHDFEKRSSKTVLDREYEKGAQKIIRIPPMEGPAQEIAYDELSQALRRFPNDRAAQERLRSESLKLLSSYASFPKKSKFVKILVPNDDKLPIRALEIYADNDKLALPNDDGAYSIPPSGEAIVRADDDFEANDSWARKKYGHLFEVHR